MNLNVMVVLVSAAAAALLGVESLRFDVEAGHTKCIAEDIRSNSMTVGKYYVVNFYEGSPLPDSHKITVRVTSALGRNYHYAENVNEGHFAFQAIEGGDYITCFFASPTITHFTSLTLDFHWNSGVAAKDWSNVAKKGSLTAMEMELKQMYDNVLSLHDDINFLRQRESEMQFLNISTNSKMAWLSFLSLLLCLSVAALQLCHLKVFFEKKKLL